MKFMFFQYLFIEFIQRNTYMVMIQFQKYHGIFALWAFKRIVTKGRAYGVSPSIKGEQDFVLFFGNRFSKSSIFFMMSVLLITCRLRINNQALQWLGCHVFPIYMYHMLFFLIARCLYKGPLSQGGALFVVVASFALSVLTACYYHKWQITLKSFRK